MNTIFPFPEGHEMKYDDENDEWYCPECGRIMKFIDGKPSIIIQGNNSAVHAGSSIPGLSMQVKVGDHGSRIKS